MRYFTTFTMFLLYEIPFCVYRNKVKCKIKRFIEDVDCGRNSICTIAGRRVYESNISFM